MVRGAPSCLGSVSGPHSWSGICRILKEVFFFFEFRFGDGDPGQLKKQTDHLNFFLSIWQLCP